MSEILTHSRMRTYRECARKHDLMYRQGFRPVKEGDALHFGTLMHKGLEAFWTGGDPLAALEGEADAFERVKAEELMRGYIIKYAHLLTEYEVLSAETVFDAPLINPATMLPSRNWRLGGKQDVILKRRSDGHVIVVEHKTTSESLTDGDYWARLQIDHQVSNYVIGAEALGFPVDDTLYDVIKKPGIRPLAATPAESRKYTKQGFLYAAQRERDETPEEFRTRLREDIEADPEKYFQQRTIVRMNSQIQDFMFDAWQTAQEIRSAAIAGRAPRNPEACLRYGRCPFWDVCVNGLVPSEHPEAFRQLDNVHPELA
jgi:PD-(D/E)XK nuclease superfamily